MVLSGHAVIDVLVRRAAAAPRARRLPDARDRVPDRPPADRHASRSATSSARCWQAWWSDRSAASRSIPMVRVVFFDLFLFATGYKVGPQFFRGLGRQALAAGLAHGRAVRDESRHGPARRQGDALRLGHRGGPDGRRLHRVHRDRHGRRRDPAAGPACRGGDAAAEQHPRGLRGELPGGHDVRRLAAVEPCPAAAARRHPQGSARARHRSSVARRGRTAVSAFDEWDRRAYVPRDGTLVGRTVREIEKTFEAQRLFVERVRRDGEICEVGPDFRVRRATMSSRSPAGAASSSAAARDTRHRGRRHARCSPSHWSRPTSS